jgi:hypothetical protein
VFDVVNLGVKIKGWANSAAKEGVLLASKDRHRDMNPRLEEIIVPTLAIAGIACAGDVQAHVDHVIVEPDVNYLDIR